VPLWMDVGTFVATAGCGRFSLQLDRTELAAA